jgi:hypothetical protein
MGWPMTATEPGPKAVIETYPALELRRRLTHGRARFQVILATSLVWMMDTALVRRLEHHHMVANTFSPLLNSMEQASTVLFLLVSLGLAVALYRSKNRALFLWGLIYLVFSLLQVVANVLSMVATASSVRGGGLTTLWDVAAVYMESVIVFMFIYIFLDLTTPGGAFVWPSRDGEPAPTPHIIDYLFISLNVNSTYGPTSEAVISRPAKLFMALQVLLAILMFTVLIARSVSA